MSVVCIALAKPWSAPISARVDLDEIGMIDVVIVQGFGVEVVPVPLMTEIGLLAIFVLAADRKLELTREPREFWKRIMLLWSVFRSLVQSLLLPDLKTVFILSTNLFIAFFFIFRHQINFQISLPCNHIMLVTSFHLADYPESHVIQFVCVCVCVCVGVGLSVRGSIFCKAFKLGYWSLQLLQELL